MGEIDNKAEKRKDADIMKKYKAVFSDIDGTLLDYENKLPASADRAIKEARKKEHRVYICTGRSEVEVYDYIWDIGLDG